MALGGGLGGGSNAGRANLFTLVIFIGLIYAAIACLSGYLFNRFVDAGLNQAAVLGTPTNNANEAFVGNVVVQYLILFTLISSMVGLASVIMGLYHSARFKDHTASGAASAHWIALLLNLLAFGIACKTLEHSHIGGGKIGHIVKAVAGLQISGTIMQLVYTILHHSVPTPNNYSNRNTASAPAGVGMSNKHHHTTTTNYVV